MDDRDGVFLASPDGQNDRLIFPDDSKLWADLKAASQANMHNGSCQVCEALLSMSDTARVSVEVHLRGTMIGGRKLAEILTANGYPAGRRAVDRHRTEGHTP